MTPLVWANFPLALLFILAFAGVPLWMTFRRPQTAPDHSESRAYLAAKQALERAGAPAPAAMTTGRRHVSAGRTTVPGRRHAGTGPVRRAHPADVHKHTGSPA